jgi:hypothetical protein
MFGAEEIVNHIEYREPAILGVPRRRHRRRRRTGKLMLYFRVTVQSLFGSN